MHKTKMGANPSYPALARWSTLVKKCLRSRLAWYSLNKTLSLLLKRHDGMVA